VTVFILAIVLAFLVGRLSRLTVRWPAWARFGAALALAGLGLLDQIPRPLPAATRQAIADRVAMDADFARELEQALPAGAMIYQLPAMPFPEIVPPHRMEDYEHFRTYVHSETLRFSYGAPKYRAISRWQRDLDDLPLGETIARLESYGFAALHINRRGFEDRADALLAELAALKDVRTLESSSRNQVVVLLSPHPRPAPPLADTLTLGDGWQTWSPRPGRVYDRSVRWSYADATLGYHNPYATPIRATLALTLSGAGPRDIEVSLNGGRIFRGAFTEEAQALPALELTLKPGYNRFDFHSPQPPARVGSVRSEPKVAIGLREMALTIDRASLPSP
jgi:hypothetical protein